MTGTHSSSFERSNLFYFYLGEKAVKHLSAPLDKSTLTGSRSISIEQDCTTLDN